MQSLILSLRLADFDLAAVRSHTRQAGELAGLETMQQTRLATAVSEIARNAKEFGRDGAVHFMIVTSPRGDGGQCFVAEVRDQGPGIPDVEAAMRGRRLPSGRISMGLPGSQRLVDRMSVTAPAGMGTVVRLEMDLPAGVRELSERDLRRMAETIGRQPKSVLQELEQQNRELLKLHQELRLKQTALEQADERKNQFVMTLAHELRTPLSTLELTLAVLRRKADLAPAELERRYGVMGRQTAQLTRLVDELMDVARVSQGKLELRKEPLDLNELVAHAMEMSGGATAARQHEVSLALAGEPLRVSGDASRLTQVVCNLVQNAARYTPERGRIAISVLREGASGVVQVSDNGIGIAAELLPHVFDLFVQGQGKPPGSEGGLGIGLTLVRHLVASHGGEVGVASEGAGLGSTFTVKLPLLEPAAAAGSP